MTMNNNSSLNCTALIPAYNEAARIKSVLKILINGGHFEQIVVVDDGSSDETSTVVRKNFPQVRLLSYKQNQGKTEAIKHALERIKSEYTFLCDADLQQLKIEEVDAALRQLAKQPTLEMIILRRVNEIQDLINQSKKFLKVELPALGIELKPKTLERLSCLLSGERILKTKTLKTLLETSDAKGYALEVAINQYHHEHQLKCCWMPSQALGSLKLEDLGFLPFLNKYISMHFNLVQQLGAKNYLQQLQSFCIHSCDQQ